MHTGILKDTVEGKIRDLDLQANVAVCTRIRDLKTLKLVCARMRVFFTPTEVRPRG